MANLLNEEHIALFQEKGWVGPFDVFSEEELEPIKAYSRSISKKIVSGGQPILTFHNQFLGIDTTREHHFSCPSLTRLFADKRIIKRLNQLGEPDLLLWRTNFFHKMPGQGGINWHQGKEYFGHEVEEDVPHERKTLHFPKGRPVYSFVVWLAIEDATLENGCVFFANGSHKHQFKTEKVPFSNGAFSGLTSQKMDWQNKKKYSKTFIINEEEWEIEPVPVKSGQILIFTEEVMHCSPANHSDEIRFGINARYVPPSVKVYPHREMGDFIDGTGHNMESHFCILVSGHDEYGLNVVRNLSDLQDIIT